MSATTTDMLSSSVQSVIVERQATVRLIVSASYIPIFLAATSLFFYNLKRKFYHNPEHAHGGPPPKVTRPLAFFVLLAVQCLLRMYFSFLQGFFHPIRESDGTKEFFNDLPAVLWMTCITMVLLQWIGIFNPKMRGTFGVYDRLAWGFAALNFVVYLVLLAAIGALNYTSEPNSIFAVKLTLILTYVLALLALAAGCLYIGQHTFRRLRTTVLAYVGIRVICSHDSQVLILFCCVVVCLAVRCGILLYEASENQADTVDSPNWMFLVYFGVLLPLTNQVGEILPSCFLMAIEHFTTSRRLADLNAEFSSLWGVLQ